MDNITILIKSLLLAPTPSEISRVKTQIQSAIGNININTNSTGKGIKLLNAKEIEAEINTINNSLTRLKVNKDKVFADSSVNKEVTKLKELENQYRKGEITLKQYRAQMDNVRTASAKMSGTLQNVNKDGYSFIQMLTLAGKKILIWGISTQLVYGTLQAIRKGLTTLKDLDTLMVDIAKVTNFTAAAMDNLKKSSFEAGSAFGRTAQDYLKSIAEFSRAGYEERSAGLAKIALLSQNVGELTAEQANQFLLATDAAYKYKGSVGELTKVLDGINEIDNKFATSIQKVSEGVTVAGSISANASVDIAELSSAIGTMTSITQRSGNEAGRAFRSILMNIRQIKG